MRRRDRQRMKVIGLILLAIAIGGMVALTAQSCGAQICVRDPIVPAYTEQERAPLRASVEEMVRARGFTVGCPAPWELVVEPLSGTATSDQTYYVASIAASRGVALVTVFTEKPSVHFHSWLVTIYPQGRVLQGQQTLGYSLRGGVRKVLRKVSRDGGK